MNTRQILYFLVLGGFSACGSDAGPKSAASTDAANGADEESADDEMSTKKPVVRDAGTAKKDAGKPGKVAMVQADDADHETASDHSSASGVDAGQKFAPIVDAGHIGHVASDTGDAGVRPVAPGDASAAAKTFCGKYEMYCGYGQMNRHADENACLADFEGNPVQQACKVMHLDTAIAGTAAACNGMPSAFCFSIHCLHATGLSDPTGVTYCK